MFRMKLVKITTSWPVNELYTLKK